jgi:hypothetical protein
MDRHCHHALFWWWLGLRAPHARTRQGTASGREKAARALTREELSARTGYKDAALEPRPDIRVAASADPRVLSSRAAETMDGCRTGRQRSPRGEREDDRGLREWQGGGNGRSVRAGRRQFRSSRLSCRDRWSWLGHSVTPRDSGQPCSCVSNFRTGCAPSCHTGRSIARLRAGRKSATQKSIWQAIGRRPQIF